MLTAGLDGSRPQAWIIRERPTPTTSVVGVGILLFGGEGALCGKAVGIGLTSSLYECNLREVYYVLGECPSFR